MTARVPLVLLPGMACDARVWDERIVRELNGAAEALLVEVLRGRRSGYGGTNTRNRSGLVRHLRFSQGGIVALELTDRAPERILGVAVIGCSARAPTPAQTVMWNALDRHAAEGRLDTVVDLMMPALLHGEARLRFGPLVRQMAHSVGAAGLREQLAAQLARSDRRARLGLVSCPALVMAGRA